MAQSVKEVIREWSCKDGLARVFEDLRQARNKVNDVS